MRRYADYKDSDADWFGSIPGSWDVVRAKNLFVERNQPSLTGEETLLTVSHITGVTPRSEKNVNMFMAETMEGYKVCHVGDLIINTMWAWMGALGTSPHHGICSPAYGVYAPRKGVPYCARYFDYLLRTPNAVVEMTRFSKGIVSSRLRLYSDKFYQIALPLPDLATQQAIADYLDAKTAQIDRKIELLTQKAAKYRQLKQAIINAAVTRGLDTSVPMKDSGVEWLGEVPAHWQMYRHKDCLSLVTNRCGDSSLAKVALENIEGQTGRYVPTDNEYDGDGIQFRTGDILFGKLRPYLAKVYLAEFEGSAVGDIFVYRAKPNILSGFAQRLMLSKRYLDVINGSTAGAKMPRVSAGFISDLPVFAPSLLEQHAIIQFLDDKTSQIDRIAEAINTQVDKLKDLRKSLINDVVTGKLRVT